MRSSGIFSEHPATHQDAHDFMSVPREDEGAFVEKMKAGGMDGATAMAAHQMFVTVDASKGLQIDTTRIDTNTLRPYTPPRSRPDKFVSAPWFVSI